jgi:hypothetical protein
MLRAEPAIRRGTFGRVRYCRQDNVLIYDLKDFLATNPDVHRDELARILLVGVEYFFDGIGRIFYGIILRWKIVYLISFKAKMKLSDGKQAGISND